MLNRLGVAPAPPSTFLRELNLLGVAPKPPPRGVAPPGAPAVSATSQRPRLGVAPKPEPATPPGRRGVSHFWDSLPAPWPGAPSRWMDDE